MAEALVRGVPLTFMNHPEAPHAFENQLADDRTREIVRGALDFMSCTSAWARKSDRSYSAYIRIIRSIARAQTSQKDFGLRLNMMQSTSGR